MAQYWQVACPDRGEQLNTYFSQELTECLPGAGYLLQLELMVPLQKQRFLFDGMLEHRNTQIETKLVNLLSKLQEEAKKNKKEDNDVDDDDEEEDNSVLKILKRIDGAIGYARPNFCVGDFFELEDISPLIRFLTETLLGNWATYPVVCVGEYAITRPSSFYPHSKSPRVYDELRKERTPNLHEFILALKRGFRRCCSAKSRRFGEFFSQVFERHFPNGDLVLLNLNTHEFVKWEYPFPGRFLEREPWELPTLGVVAISLICWSQDSFGWQDAWPKEGASGLPDGFDMEGKWACHSLAILPQCRLDIVDKTWKDITEEAFHVVEQAWYDIREEGFVDKYKWGYRRIVC